MVAIKANLVGVEKALFMKLGVIEPIKQILHRQLGFMVDMKVEVSWQSVLTDKEELMIEHLFVSKTELMVEVVFGRERGTVFFVFALVKGDFVGDFTILF